MTTIRANVSLMFANLEPCYVSGSQAELGNTAARLTWNNALRVAENADRWLFTPLPQAAEAMRAWARETGAWTRSETEAWSDTETLALFCQNVASEVRTLGCHHYIDELLDCADREEERHAEVDYEPEVTGHYYRQSDNVWVDWYAGI